MKRLTKRRRNWFAHRHQYEAKRRARKKMRLLEATFTVHTHTGANWHARPPSGPARLVMPENLCFDENPGESLEALEKLRRRLETIPTRINAVQHLPSKHRRARVRRLGMYAAFETMQRISPAAALVLAAAYEQWLLRTSQRAPVAGVEHWHTAVFDTLWNIGFFDLVWADKVEQSDDAGADVVVLRMQSGNTADPDEVNKLIDGLKRLYPGDEETSEPLIHLYGAMIEAVTNVLNHAYPKNWSEVPRPELRRWWMTGAVDRQNRRTTAVVFDRGITIPVSLPNWENAEGWLRRMASRMARTLGVLPAVDDPKSDGDAIAAAVEESVSSTGERHRGTGLAQMRGFVDECQEGRFRIMSRCGEVIFRPGQQPEVRTYDVPLRGTLIEWSLSL